MVRFRGTHDRRTLILAFGFVLSGVIETVATFNFYDILAAGASAQIARASGLDGQPDAAGPGLDCGAGCGAPRSEFAGTRAGDCCRASSLWLSWRI